MKVGRLFLVAAMMLAAACSPQNGRYQTAPLPTAAPTNAQAVIVDWIIDGDTIRIRAKESGTPIRATGKLTARLLEIDTPETQKPDKAGECFADEATEAAKRLLPTGSTAFVTADRDTHDNYGRFLLYIWNSDGIFVNLNLIENGYAEAIMVRPNDRYIEKMRAAERRARAEKRGQWGVCA